MNQKMKAEAIRNQQEEKIRLTLEPLDKVYRIHRLASNIVILCYSIEASFDKALAHLKTGSGYMISTATVGNGKCIILTF